MRAHLITLRAVFSGLGVLATASACGLSVNGTASEVSGAEPEASGVHVPASTEAPATAARPDASGVTCADDAGCATTDTDAAPVPPPSSPALACMNATD